MQSPEWYDPEAARDMQALLAVRSNVLAALETARQDKCVSSASGKLSLANVSVSRLLRSSLEADIYLIMPNDAPAESEDLLKLLKREGTGTAYETPFQAYFLQRAFSKPFSLCLMCI